MSEHFKINNLILIGFKIILLSEMSSANNGSHKLTAISGPDAATILYKRIKHENPHTEEPPFMNPDIKNKVCHYMTGSAYFYHVTAEEQVYMYQLHKKLRVERPDIFQYLYEPSTSPPDDMVYTNPTRWVNVIFPGEEESVFDEYVFICLTANLQGKLSLYFISKEYNLSDIPDLYAAGRFIFQYEGHEQTNLFAIAEEPAKTLSAPGAEVERSYLDQRAERNLAENEINDSICNLTLDESLRICSLVLNSDHFKGELEFIHWEHNTFGCIKREISFQDDEIRLEKKEEQYAEWMISCRPDLYYATFQATYFLSRSYNSNTEVFAFRRGEDSQIVLENLFGNVRFMIHSFR